MLELIIGGRGHGKSAYATYHAVYDYEKRGKKIYSNYWIDLPYTPLNMNNLHDISNASVFVDEAYILANARLSQSKQNRLVNYLVFQSRKVDVDLYFIAQLSRTIDVLIRDSADKISYCKALYRDEDGILRVKDQDTDKIERVSIITYDQNNDRYSAWIFNPLPFFKYFNSKERIPTEYPYQPEPMKKNERNKKIKSMYKNGATIKEIAEEFGLSRQTVSKIVK